MDINFYLEGCVVLIGMLCEKSLLRVILKDRFWRVFNVFGENFL